MIPCISQVTTLSTPFEAELGSIARAGFPAVELWLTKLEEYLRDHTPDQVRDVLERNELRPLAASSQGGLLRSVGEERALHWDQFARRLDLLSALGVPVLVVTPDFPVEPQTEDLRRAVERLAEAGELAARSGVRLALEFQKSAKFAASLDTTVALIAQAGAEEQVGICLDLFHYYTGPSKFEDLGYLSAANLVWLQLCDLSGTPRELAGDSDRILPGEGDFQIEPILDHLQGIGYQGGASLELLNPTLWSIPADRVADVGYQAVARTLGTRLSGERT